MVMYVDMRKFTLNSGSLFGCNVARAFPVRAALILFLSILGHKIGVLKSTALFQEKELQVTLFKIKDHSVADSRTRSPYPNPSEA